MYCKVSINIEIPQPITITCHHLKHLDTPYMSIPIGTKNNTLKKISGSTFEPPSSKPLYVSKDSGLYNEDSFISLKITVEQKIRKTYSINNKLAITLNPFLTLRNEKAKTMPTNNIDKAPS